MSINLDCTECKSEISVSGYDDKDDITIFVKCHNCLADVKIVKENGEIKEIEVKGKKHYSGFTSAFNKYQPDDMDRIK